MEQALILVCDDDPDIRIVLGQLLSSSGYRVVHAADGKEAQEKLRLQEPDLILLDILMPKLSGLDFLQWLRQQPTINYIPVLLLTALTNIGDRVKGLDAGADDYLGKPFEVLELRARVKALLRVRQLMIMLNKKNAELQTLQQQLLAKERELVAIQLGGAAAHALGQPLTSIRLQIKHLECLLSSSKEKGDVADVISALQKECDTMQGLIERVSATKGEAEAYVGDLKILSLKGDDVS